MIADLVCWSTPCRRCGAPSPLTLKRSVSWVYHRVEDGTLPVKRLAGWGVRFIPAELRAWVQDGGGSRR